MSAHPQREASRFDLHRWIAARHLFNGSEAAWSEGHRGLKAVLVADERDAKVLHVRGGRF